MGQEKNISADGFLHAGGIYGVKKFTATKPLMGNVVPKTTVVGTGTGVTGTGYTPVNPNVGSNVTAFTNQNANLPIVAVNPTIANVPTVGVGVYNPTTGVDSGIITHVPINTMQSHLTAIDNTALTNLLNQTNPVISPVVPPVVNPVTPPVAPPQTGGGGGGGSAGGGGGDASGGSEADASQEENQGEVASEQPIIDDSHDELSGELDEEATTQEVESDRGSYFAEGESSVMELKNAASKENEVFASMGMRGITNGEIVLASSIIVGLILLRIATK